MKSLKRKVYEIIETSDGDNKWSDRFDTAVITVISLNLVAIILESVEQLHHDYQAVFYYFELFSIIFFTTEYLLRLWTITENPRFARPVRGRLRFMLTPFALIDLVAILPFYLPAIVIDFRFLRMIRLFRVFRLLKVARYMRAITIISRVLREKKEEMVISVFAILFTLVLVSSFMFFIEHDAQPDKYTSIPATMWWGVATVTSVGYGDIYPITPWGKFLGSFVAILGLGLFAPAHRHLRLRLLRRDQQAQGRGEAQPEKAQRAGRGAAAQEAGRLPLLRAPLPQAGA